MVKGKSAKWYAARKCAGDAARAQRERNIIKCCETCKHVRETISGELYCFDPAQGCNEAECIGNMTLVCDNWVIASNKGTKTIVIKAESAYCPICDGPGGFMGQLGNLLWFRCISCGMEFNRKAE